MMERYYLWPRVINKGVIPLFLFFVLVTPVSAIGVGASPDRIEFGTVSKNIEVIQELYVINTGDETEQFTLTVEGADISIDTEEFNLHSKQTRAVNVSINAVEAGEYSGNILITASPLDSGLSGLGFGAALRVPVSVVVKDDIGIKSPIVMGSLAAIVAIMAIIPLHMRLKKK